jgi:hypothetical protein
MGILFFYDRIEDCEYFILFIYFIFFKYLGISFQSLWLAGESELRRQEVLQHLACIVR